MGAEVPWTLLPSPLEPSSLLLLATWWHHLVETKTQSIAAKWPRRYASQAHCHVNHKQTGAENGGKRWLTQSAICTEKSKISEIAMMNALTREGREDVTYPMQLWGPLLKVALYIKCKQAEVFERPNTHRLSYTPRACFLGWPFTRNLSGCQLSGSSPHSSSSLL